MCPMISILIIVFIEVFTILHGVSGAIQQASFLPGRPIARMFWLIFLELSRTTLIVVDWKGIFYLLEFPVITVTVFICLVVGGFRSFYSLVYLFCHFHGVKNSACLLVVIFLEVPSL